MKRFPAQKRLGELSASQILLLLLAAALPLERIPSFEAYGITIKLSLIFGLALILSNLAWLAGAKGRLLRKETKRLLRLVWPILAFIGYSLLSLIWSQSFSYWLRSNLTLIFVAALTLSVCMTILSSDKNFKNLVIKVILATSLLVIFFGFFQWLGDLLGLSPSLTQIRPEYAVDKLGLPRMQSTFLEPLYFGLFLLLPLSLSLADRKNQFFKSLYWRLGFIALTYAGILLSLARGAIAASAILGVIAIFYNLGELRKQLKLRSAIKAGLAGALTLALLALTITLLGKRGTDEDHNYTKGLGTIVGHLETIKPWGSKADALEQNSINSRDVARGEAWSMINRSPQNFILGVGAGQYGGNLNPKQGFAATSNFMFLDVWAEYGLVGLSLLIIFFGHVLVLLVRLKRSYELAFGASLFIIGFLIQSISFGELTITSFWFTLGFSLALKVQTSHYATLRQSEVASRT